MRLELTGRHIDITPTVRSAVQRAVKPVLRMLNDSAMSAHVVLTKQKTRVHAEVTVHARGVHFLHGEATGLDVALATGAAAAKVERQAAKLKGKWNTRKGGRRVSEGLPAPRPAAPARRVVRVRRPAVKPMSVDDAADMLTDDGVVVFRNITTDALSILFRRPDGNLGLIEPEA